MIVDLTSHKDTISLVKCISKSQITQKFICILITCTSILDLLGWHIFSKFVVKVEPWWLWANMSTKNLSSLENLYTSSAIQLYEDTLQDRHSTEATSFMWSQGKNENHVLLLIFYDGHRNRLERLISFSLDFEELN